uniref:C2H2-type domain-containing protein n=1 Tax=Steinernema glaseri TaxID=37863 RepID=A0A1I7XW65_9BILA
MAGGEHSLLARCAVCGEEGCQCNNDSDDNVKTEVSDADADPAVSPKKKSDASSLHFGKKLTENIQVFHNWNAHEPRVKKVHSCDLCSKTYKTKMQLTEHVEIFHLHQKNYTCDVCSTSFGRRGTLRHHKEMVHLGKTFKCTYENCEHPAYKCFKALCAHIRSAHTGERPYKCSFCVRTFVRSNDKKMHEEIHNDPRAQNCGRCGVGFKSEARHKTMCEALKSDGQED